MTDIAIHETAAVLGFRENFRAEARVVPTILFIELRASPAFADLVALHSALLRRQHFFKREAVFLSALVYSECSAFRFPSAHSD
jgi:hypothetical protein